MRKKTALYIIYGDLALNCALLLAAMGIVFLLGLRVERTPKPASLGNHPHNIAQMENVDPERFTFFVMSDIKTGTATFEKLLSIAQQDNPAFGVILGDIVANPWLIEHKLLGYRISKYRPDFPIFLTIGNHGVSEQGPFGLTQYEQVYGPTQFHFAIGRYLFIFLRNADLFSKSGDWIAHFESVLAEYEDPETQIIVFMHVPPSSFHGTVLMSGAAHSKRFMELAEARSVRFVFSGDHHGYAKHRVGQTTYIITGGGGDRLRGDHGRFHHFTRIAVHRGRMSETVIAVERRDETMRQLERNIVTYVWPLMAGNTVRRLISAGLALVLLAAMVCCLRQIKRIRHRSASSQVSTA